jgi:hypothetical protein
VLTDVMPCFTEALQLMRVGGKSRIVCPSDLAYGDRGSAPKVPPGATVEYDVELLAIVPSQARSEEKAPRHKREDQSNQSNTRGGAGVDFPSAAEWGLFFHVTRLVIVSPKPASEDFPKPTLGRDRWPANSHALQLVHVGKEILAALIKYLAVQGTGTVEVSQGMWLHRAQRRKVG